MPGALQDHKPQAQLALLPLTFYSQMALAPEEADWVFSNVTTTAELLRDQLPLKNEWIQALVPLEGSATPGYSKVYRNKGFPNHLKKTLIEGIDTYHQYFEALVALNREQRCFGYRVGPTDPTYHYLTYGEVQQLRDQLGSGLLHLLKANPYKQLAAYDAHRKIDTHEKEYPNFYRDQKHSFCVGLYLTNRYEWVTTDLMCLAFSITNTALYDTLGVTALEFILATTECPVVFALGNHIRRLATLKQQNPQKLGQLIQIVLFDPITDPQVVEFAAQNKIQVVSFDDVVAAGKAHPGPTMPSHPDTIYTILFTSGTTGTPKGVISLQLGAAAGITFNMTDIPTKQGWRYFSFLPLAHIMERQTMAGALAAGGVIGFPPNGYTPANYFQYVKEWKPHVLANVPRIWNKLEALIKKLTTENLRPEVREAWELLILQRKRGRGPLNYQAELFETSITKLLRRFYGFDNLQYLITGAAPLSLETIEFLRCTLDIGMALGMGMTELFGGFAMTNPWLRPKKGKPYSVGLCSVACEWRLREIPGIDTKHDLGQRGELQIRGPQVFCGYYKNPEETQKAFDNGWFSTGDVGAIDEDGMLYIIDRIKLYLKLSQGEFVAPEKIETAYLGGNAVLTHCYVHGDSRADFIVGVVGMAPKDVARFVTKHLGRDVSEEEAVKLVNRFDVKLALLRQLNQPMGELCGFEKLHNIVVAQDPLDGCMTPSLKLQRPKAFAKWEPQILDMYSEGSLLKPAKL